MARTKKQLTIISEQQWIKLSNNAVIQKNIKNDLYSEAYLSLARLFPNIQKTHWDGAVTALHIVYGWMPTIPKLKTYQHWNATDKSRLVDILQKAKKGLSLNRDELLHLKVFSNNSIVGGSKILHFVSPKLFPIWDTRVARAFYNREKVYAQQVNNIDCYLNYREALLSWMNNAEVSSQLSLIKGLAPFLKTVADLRMIELVLFHKT
jgi:hypothetical protein